MFTPDTFVGKSRALVSWWNRPRNKYSVDRFNYNIQSLSKSLPPTPSTIPSIIENIREIGELICWGDSKNPSIFDVFMEVNGFNHIFSAITKCNHPQVYYHFLQSFNIIIHSMKTETNLFYLFSNNRINKIILVQYPFNSNTEILNVYVTLLKTLSLKLTAQNIVFFWNLETNTFPLYTQSLTFYNHPDRMVRAATRNIQLNIFKIFKFQPRLEKLILGTASQPYYNNVMKSLFSMLGLFDDALNQPSSSSSLITHLGDLIDDFSYIDDVLNIEIRKLDSVLVDRIHQQFILLLMNRIQGFDFSFPELVKVVKNDSVKNNAQSESVNETVSQTINSNSNTQSEKEDQYQPQEKILRNVSSPPTTTPSSNTSQPSTPIKNKNLLEFVTHSPTGGQVLDSVLASAVNQGLDSPMISSVRRALPKTQFSLKTKPLTAWLILLNMLTTFTHKKILSHVVKSFFNKKSNPILRFLFSKQGIGPILAASTLIQLLKTDIVTQKQLLDSNLCSQNDYYLPRKHPSTKQHDPLSLPSHQSLTTLGRYIKSNSPDRIEPKPIETKLNRSSSLVVASPIVGDSLDTVLSSNGHSLQLIDDSDLKDDTEVVTGHVTPILNDSLDNKDESSKTPTLNSLRHNNSFHLPQYIQDSSNSSFESGSSLPSFDVSIGPRHNSKQSPGSDQTSQLSSNIITSPTQVLHRFDHIYPDDIVLRLIQLINCTPTLAIKNIFAYCLVQFCKINVTSPLPMFNNTPRFVAHSHLKPKHLVLILKSFYSVQQSLLVLLRPPLNNTLDKTKPLDPSLEQSPLKLWKQFPLYNISISTVIAKEFLQNLVDKRVPPGDAPLDDFQPGWSFYVFENFLQSDICRYFNSPPMVELIDDPLLAESVHSSPFLPPHSNAPYRSKPLKFNRFLFVSSVENLETEILYLVKLFLLYFYLLRSLFPTFVRMGDISGTPRSTPNITPRGHGSKPSNSSTETQSVTTTLQSATETTPFLYSKIPILSAALSKAQKKLQPVVPILNLGQNAYVSLSATFPPCPYIMRATSMVNTYEDTKSSSNTQIMSNIVPAGEVVGFLIRSNSKAPPEISIAPSLYYNCVCFDSPLNDEPVRFLFCKPQQGNSTLLKVFHIVSIENLECFVDPKSPKFVFIYQPNLVVDPFFIPSEFPKFQHHIPFKHLVNGNPSQDSIIPLEFGDAQSASHFFLLVTHQLKIKSQVGKHLEEMFLYSTPDPQKIIDKLDKLVSDEKTSPQK